MSTMTTWSAWVDSLFSLALALLPHNALRSFEVMGAEAPNYIPDFDGSVGRACV
jgi:hypothetical protein